MSPPTAPITSTSSARSKKQKPTEKRAKKPAKVAAAASSSDAEDRTMLAHEQTRSVDPTPAYVPPAGSVPADLDVDVDFGEFDYDAVAAEEGAELWLVRAPTAVKAKNLQGIQVLSSAGVSGRVGELSRKSTAYDIWSLSPPSSSSGDRHQPHVGAEELNGLSVLLPRKQKGGKLFLAPKSVARHLVVAARPAEPMRRDAASDPVTFQNPPREAYPDEALTHRFRPYGDLGDPPPAPPEDQLDLGVDDRHAEEGGAREKEKEKRKKRRGGEAVESPKKAKRAKTATS
ncbi:hypothetical protein EDB92DRAFT_1899627 [Lactarius akahatsu]|uniref:DNA-directed RNA polymerase I subunit RPA34 n=1 Tax=Lactarius akahatsu TaxID=416441 RepID=A0AAD4LC14_9AGAM|nr:hypothetical protein EDB92DRAFT_1899627 [Lactarius akahatsu]